ncbi:hypothetical protein C1645_771284 [Glomus cerebriforme]|uniref:Uncharacterized protein n=1 Tax=Glomus cerebriforme TaxID=658196 RepID=A0A397T404_9GLOM|nr:hypothetical protein C1645_771284 [Glomus cerebriforme]
MNNQTESKIKPIKPKCNLFELVQYQCIIKDDRVICSPFVRIFKRCSGKPTVEITPYYDDEGSPIEPKRTNNLGFWTI